MKSNELGLSIGDRDLALKIADLLEQQTESGSCQTAARFIKQGRILVNIAVIPPSVRRHAMRLTKRQIKRLKAIAAGEPVDKIGKLADLGLVQIDLQEGHPIITAAGRRHIVDDDSIVVYVAKELLAARHGRTPLWVMADQSEFKRMARYAIEAVDTWREAHSS